MKSTLIIAAFLVAVVCCDFQKPALPVFLRGADDAAKNQFLEIVNNEELTREQKDDQVEALIATQPQNIKDAFEQFRAKVDANRKRFNESVGQQLAGLSPEAPNEQLPVNREQKAQEFFDSLPASVQKELTELKSKLPEPRIQPEMTTDH
ncbi:unnamed protein product [Caenorhabditis auriculariae]|uniref:SXP/RAL-2 family protein Ani s 5-like cation-binding domain-containing protein n=1 Tax=Caenorhabditis auriculariae TaxID=2777116 RepID=A0A8S1HHC8_9PELO|nr:unnamed protein product [Caenorhabditis auriculariae]